MWAGSQLHSSSRYRQEHHLALDGTQHIPQQGGRDPSFFGLSSSQKRQLAEVLWPIARPVAPAQSVVGLSRDYNDDMGVSCVAKVTTRISQNGAHRSILEP